MSITDSSVLDTQLDGNKQYGVGVLFGGDVTGRVERVTVTRSQGIGIAADAAGVTVMGTMISSNAVGVYAAEGTSLREGEGEVDGFELLVSPDTRFIDNATRVGSGPVALPSVIEAASLSR